jgi:hypothetical protein
VRNFVPSVCTGEFEGIEGRNISKEFEGIESKEGIYQGKAVALSCLPVPGRIRLGFPTTTVAEIPDAGYMYSRTVVRPYFKVDLLPTNIRVVPLNLV